jgi:MFS family permease
MSQTHFPSKEAQRRAISALFFLHGICFSSWASRIPDLQHQLQLSDPALGFLLFFIPVGDLMTMPFSSWITTRLGSRRLSVYSMMAYASVLAFIGWAPNVHLLVVGMLALGMTSNLVNICVNTQSVEVQKL